MSETSRASGAQIANTARNGVAWTGAGQALKQFLEFGVGILMARLLTPKEFGVISICSILFSFISIFTSFGFNNAVVQRPHLEEEYLRSAQTLSVALGCLGTLLMTASAPLIAIFFNNDSLRALVPAMSVIFLVSSFSIVPTALLTRGMRFRELMIVSLLATVGYGVTAVTLALTGCGVWSLVWSPVVSVFVTALGSSCCARYYPRFGYSSSHGTTLIRFGGVLTVSSLLNHLARNADNIVVGRFLGASPLGLYSRAYNLATMPKEILVPVLGTVLFPSFASMQHDRELTRRAYQKSVKGVVLLCMPVCLTLCLVAPEFVEAVYGVKWQGAVRPLRILSVAGFLYTLYVPCTSLLLGNGLAKLYGKLQLFYSTCTVVFVLIAFAHGIDAVALAVALSIATSFVLYGCAVNKLLGITWFSFLDAIGTAGKGTALLAVVLVMARMVGKSMGMAPQYLLLLEVLPGAAAYLAFLGSCGESLVLEVAEVLGSYLKPAIAKRLASTEK